MEIDNLEDITTVEIIENLENVLHNAVKQSIPKHRKNSRIKRTGRKIWKGKIAQASKISKSKFYTWKMNKNNNNAKKDMVLSKRQLRGLQRQAYASKKRNFMNKIMSASENDTEMFHKLINNQRRNKHQNTEILILNEKNLTDENDILNG